MLDLTWEFLAGRAVVVMVPQSAIIGPAGSRLRVCSKCVEVSRHLALRFNVDVPEENVASLWCLLAPDD